MSFGVWLWCIQVQTDISVDTKQQTLQGVAFPVHKDAIAALERFRDKKINYVQLVSFNKHIINKKATERSLIWISKLALSFMLHLWARGMVLVRRCLQTGTMSYWFVQKSLCLSSSHWNSKTFDVICAKYKGIIVALLQLFHFLFVSLKALQVNSRFCIHLFDVSSWLLSHTTATGVCKRHTWGGGEMFSHLPSTPRSP